MEMRFNYGVQSKSKKEREMDVTSRRVVNALKTAIRREERTSAAYTSKAKKTRNPAAKKVLESLAKQEIGHANKLLKVLNRGADLTILGKKGRELAAEIKVVNDDIREIENAEEVVKVLRKASKAEENSARFYRSMEKIYKGIDVADLFGRLAEEEDKHKDRLETVLARM